MYSFAKGFTTFPKQGPPQTSISPPFPPSRYTSSPLPSGTSTPDYYLQHLQQQNDIIHHLSTTISHLAHRISQLEETVRVHTSISDDQIHTFTKNQQLIYDKIRCHTMSPTENASITTPNDPLVPKHDSISVNKTPISNNDTPSHDASSPLDLSRPASPHQHPQWPSHSISYPLPQLQTTTMNPQYEYQHLYVPIKKRISAAHMRQQLRDIGLPSYSAIDIHYPALNIVSLTVRNQHFDRCQSTLHAANLTTIPDFDPLDPAHLINKNFQNHSIAERTAEIKRICRAQKLSALRRIAPQLQIDLAQVFYRKSWIQENDLNSILKAAHAQLEVPSIFLHTNTSH
ncbi:hypothetical protein V8B55DRAFT_1363377 [Mucor lusitanicus]|uniref:Uncharacterized protein n=3 Tax=Mucor circinelloides f. lusitanicus TaxID=29924 RepID=A0A168LQB4_MUCCL|nr:hypothetical protein MUCCIDRAFT_163370 [Mucor lusitanicus CBS 277.49]